MNEPAAVAPGLKPLFRWPGGKRWLVPALLELVPRSFGRYIEPFVGAGALFFALRPESAILVDANKELATAYTVLRDEPHALATRLSGLPRDRAAYLSVRSSTPRDEVGVAARFIYLATLAFNGIYRVNKRGEFNVPYGGREYPGLGDLDELLKYSTALDGAEVESGDFEQALNRARSGDFVYLDPPYTVGHTNNGFLKYNEKLFSWSDQQRLARCAEDLVARGCSVVISSALHESTVSLFGAFRRIDVARHSTISALPKGRGLRPEVLFTNVY